MYSLLLYLSLILQPNHNDSIKWYDLNLHNNQILIIMPTILDTTPKQYLPAKNDYIAYINNIYFEFNFWENDTNLYQKSKIFKDSLKFVKGIKSITKLRFYNKNIIHFNDCSIIEYNYCRIHRKGLKKEKEKGITRYYKINNTIYYFAIAYLPKRKKIKKEELIKLKDIFFNSLKTKL